MEDYRVFKNIYTRKKAKDDNGKPMVSEKPRDDEDERTTLIRILDIATSTPQTGFRPSSEAR